MKKILIIMIFALLAGCASKEPPFDAVAVFKEAEKNMRAESFEKARKGYQEIQEKSPDKSYDADLMLRIADTYYGEEQYSEAQVEYQAFLNYHPVHRDAAYAQYQIGMCSYKDLTTFDRDPAPAHAVIREMQKVLEKYPKSGYEDQARKYISICTDWVAEYELYVARFYYKKGSYQAAVGRCEKLLRDYPDTRSEKDALYYAGLSYRELGEKDLARARFETLAQKYPAMKKTALYNIEKLHLP
ncbi:MAG: outer membrane protein assembly factor BamD [Nitrospirae bacterium]|nr:outer membrane protein assembly factor BamD [Nitrospirota bacterium]